MNLQFVRREAPNNRDFRVLIDGEHRATFRSLRRYHRIGYELKDTNGDDISLYRRYRSRGVEITKEAFPEVINAVINAIPTVAELEMARLNDQAHRENRERDDAIAAHQTQVRRGVLVRALELFLEKNSTTTEEQDAARTLLARYRSSTLL